MDLHLNESYRQFTNKSTIWQSKAKENDMETMIQYYLAPLNTAELLRLDIISIIMYSSGVIINAIFLLYLLYFKRYKTPVFCVILGLNVGDLGVCAAALFWTAFVSPVVRGPPWMCNIARFLLNSSFLSSCYHLVTFVVLRFFQLVYPLSSRAHLTTRLMRGICIGIWLASLIHDLVSTFFYKAMRLKYKGNNVYMCFFVANIKIYSIWVSIVGFLLPFLITTTIFHIAKHLVVLFRKSGLVPVKSSVQDGQTRRVTDSRALAIIITLYLITICPAAIHDLLIIVFGVALPPSQWLVSHVMYQLIYWSSALNPWIYFIAAESVRADIRALFASRRNNTSLRPANK